MLFTTLSHVQDKGDRVMNDVKVDSDTDDEDETSPSLITLRMFNMKKRT